MKLTHPASASSRCIATLTKKALLHLLAGLIFLAGVQQAAAQGTAFSYQGWLNSGGAPANGNYDFAFALYNDPLTGSQVGAAETNGAVAVSDGLFTTTLDFASAPWNGQALWLQILVRTNGGGPFSSLTPRQPLTSSPYAIQSLTATTATSANSVAATNLSGTILNSALPPSPVFSGSISGNGGGLTNLNASQLSSGVIPLAQLPAAVVTNNQSGVALNGAFSGSGSGLTNLNPSNLTAGTAGIDISGNATTATTATNLIGNVSDAQLSANMARLNGANAFTGSNNFAGVTIATNGGNFFGGTFTGNLSGNATTAATAITFSGMLDGDVRGTQRGTLVASVGGLSAANVAAGASAANAATSANTAGTIVLRDAAGNFAAGAITAISLFGDGGGLTNLNPASLDAGTAAINISGNAATATSAANVTGIIADFQLSTNVPLLDGTNSFTGTNDFAGVTVATNANNFFEGAFAGNLSGNGSGLTNVNAATLGGSITSDSFSALNNALIAETNRAAAAEYALSTNMAQLNGANTFTGMNTFAGVVLAINTNNVINGNFAGNLSGNATTALTANNFSGSLSGDVTGTQGATMVATVGGQSAANVASGASAANAATSSNAASTIVLRDAAGNFAAGAITAISLSGDGGGLTNLNPASLDAGTAAINISGNAATATSAANLTGNIADFQLSTNVPLLNGTNSFTGTNNFAGVTIATNGGNLFGGTFTGNLSGNATTASSAVSATTAMMANNFSGSLSGDVLGTQRDTMVVNVGGQSAANVAGATSLANSATSLNTVGTIVKRDASGNFSAGTITATAFNGDGAGLTNLNPAQLTFTADENIDIGTASAPGDDGIMRLGTQGIQTNAYVAGVFGATAASGVAVYVNSTGQLGTLTSSRKYKQDIRNMDDASDGLLALHPVTFRYKPELDPAGIPQFGLVAEEVEKVNPDLVAHDNQGHPYTVRYEAVNAMLLNEFLKEHRKVEAQSAKIDELTQRLDRLEKMVSETVAKR